MISSPCVRLCVLDDNDVCRGCARHIDEIVRWEALSDEVKGAIWERVRAERERARAELSERNE